MAEPTNHRRLALCCYVGMFVQATTINLAAVLFIPLREQFGLSFEQIGRLVLINFTTQLLTDLVAGPLVDRHGPKAYVVAANALSALGLALFAIGPWIMPTPYLGLILGTVVFSVGAGLLEVLLSPIIDSIPSKVKDQAMSLAHSFYAWGQMTVVLVTTLAIFAFGSVHWPWIVMFWAILPAVNAVGFARLPLPKLRQDADRQRLRELILNPWYLAAVCALGLAGATEVSLNQWISSFGEVGLGLTKLQADVGGMALFAMMLGAGRLWFGLYGGRANTMRLLQLGAAASVVVYLVAALAPVPGLGLAACVLGGLTVSLLWPGLVSTTAARFPRSGASMFAFLAACGDLGAAVAPWMVGGVADAVAAGGGAGWLARLLPAGLDSEQMGLRAGLLTASLAPLALLAVLLLIGRRKESGALPKPVETV